MKIVMDCMLSPFAQCIYYKIKGAQQLRTGLNVNNKTTKDGGFKLTQGQLVILSTERYSDYSYTGPFICNRDFDLSNIANEIKEQSSGSAGPNRVTLHLLNNGFISKVDCREIHLGTEGNIEPSNWNISKSDLDDELEYGGMAQADYELIIMQCGL